MAISQEMSHGPETPVSSDRRAAKQSGEGRVASIDIFRGLTMVVMVFVNQIAEMKGLPWWTYHMPGSVNGMTYVDMVFPSGSGTQEIYCRLNLVSSRPSGSVFR